jgi:hypothetical protein
MRGTVSIHQWGKPSRSHTSGVLFGANNTEGRYVNIISGMCAGAERTIHGSDEHEEGDIPCNNVKAFNFGPSRLTQERPLRRAYHHQYKI